MPTRDQVEQTIQPIYEARARGDLDTVMRAFTDDAKYTFVGNSSSDISIAGAGHSDLRTHLAGLTTTFEMRNPKILDVVADGDKAAVHWQVDVRSTLTNDQATTEMMHLIKFRDGRIASVTEFCDTALAARMLG